MPLLPALLHVEDRVSMAHGVESRVPLLDHPLVEVAATIPADSTSLLRHQGRWSIAAGVEKSFSFPVSKPKCPSVFVLHMELPRQA